MSAGEQIEAAVLRDADGGVYIVPRAELERWRLPDVNVHSAKAGDVQGYAVDGYLYFKDYRPGLLTEQTGQVFNFSFQPVTLPSTTPPTNPV